MDKNILIVDDSIEWLNSHLTMFTSLFPGHKKPDTAESAKDAFLKVITDKTKYDLIISDMEMEKVLDENYAGEWLVKKLKLRDECSDTKFLVISGAYDIEDIAKRLDVDYIPKGDLLSNALIFKYKIEEMFA